MANVSKLKDKDTISYSVKIPDSSKQVTVTAALDLASSGLGVYQADSLLKTIHGRAWGSSIATTIDLVDSLHDSLTLNYIYQNAPYYPVITIQGIEFN